MRGRYVAIRIDFSILFFDRKQFKLSETRNKSCISVSVFQYCLVEESMAIGNCTRLGEAFCEYNISIYVKMREMIKWQ